MLESTLETLGLPAGRRGGTASPPVPKSQPAGRGRGVRRASRLGRRVARRGSAAHESRQRNRLSALLLPGRARSRRRLFCFAKPVAIGNDCWFGANVVVCPGVTIGDRCVIGAGSVVTRDVPPDSFAAGNPCRVIRAITEADSMVHKPAVLAGNRVIG